MRRRSVPGLLALLCACASSRTGDDPPRRDERPPDVEAKYEAAIERGEARIGMTKDEVRQAIGPPNRTKRGRWRDRPADIWYYTWSEVYFRDGYMVHYVAYGR